MKTLMVLLTAGCVALASGCAAARPGEPNDLDVPMTLMETAGVERVADPVSVGVPMPRNLLMETDRLYVVDPAGQPTPAQFSPLMKWYPTERYPDAAGIRWVLVDFQADVPANGKATYRLRKRGPGEARQQLQPAQPVEIEKTDEAIHVKTGTFRFSVNRNTFRLFDRVELDGRVIVDAGEDDGMCIEGMDGERYYASRDLREPPTLTGDDYRNLDAYLRHIPHNPPEKLRVTVEESGPVRSVIMIDGVMTAQQPGEQFQFVLYDAGGDEVGPLTFDTREENLGFRIRIHAYAGKPFVRVFHTLINLRGKSNTPTDMNRYRSAAYIADSITTPGTFLVEALELGTTLKLDGRPTVLFGGDTVHRTASEAGPWELYQDSSAGWVWQAGEDNIYCPILKANMEWHGRNGQLEKPYHEYGDIHYKILTGQDGSSFMGYKVYDGEEQHQGNRAAGWMDVSDGTVGMTTAVRWFWKMFPKSLAVDESGVFTVGILPTRWGRGHFLDGKIHRTHELLYRFRGPEPAEATEAAARAFEEPLVAHCGFDWYLASDACGLMARPDRENWPLYEQQLLTAVHVGINPEISPSLDSSIALEREKNDAFGWQHFGDTPKRGFRGHSQFQEFDVSHCLLTHFYRTGDPAFFRTAEELARFLMNIPAFGGGHGHQHPEPSHNWIQGLIDYWALTGMPEAREGIEAMRGYYKDQKSPDAFCWRFNGRNAAYAINGLRQMFELTGEQKWLDALNLNIRNSTRRTRHISGFYGGNPAPFMSYTFIHALGRYALLTGDEDAVDLLLGLTGFFKPLSNQGRGGGTADAYAYATILTRDRRYLDVAIENNTDRILAGTRDYGPAYRTGISSSKTWSGAVGGYGQIFFYATKEWEPGDLVSPAPITDLKAEPGPEPGSVKLTWTNAADNAAKLQIKYAEGEIVEYIHWAREGRVDGRIADPEDQGKVNFWYATNATGEPEPGEPGTVQSWVLTDLQRTDRRGQPVTLWFAAKVHDHRGTRSDISNSVNVTVP